MDTYVVLYEEDGKVRVWARGLSKQAAQRQADELENTNKLPAWVSNDPHWSR